MDEKEKFRIKTYLKYLLISPWQTKVNMPNFRTAIWILIIISFVFRLRLILFITLGIAVIQYLWCEYKSGKHIHWYRMRMYREQKDALKKVREERKTQHLNTLNTKIESERV